MSDTPPAPDEIIDITVPVSEMRDQNDEKELRHGRQIHHAFPVGAYLQPPPFFFTRDKWPIPLVDHYRGGACFLIAGGPSFGRIDQNRLREPGIITLGLNNSVKSFRPEMWTCVDDPSNFIMSLWLDPKIMKFVPISHIDKTLFDSHKWEMTDIKVGDCPNIVYYKRNEKFQPQQYLCEDTINWGNHTNLGGGRSVMLAAIRILYMLGIRKLFLLGVDFKMDADTRYHFDQDRASGSIKGNNATYKQLIDRFTELRPIFEKNNFHVYNCNPDSGLKVFDHMPFDDAITIAKGLMPNTFTEPTQGLYDRKANERKNKQTPPSPDGKGRSSRGAACDPAPQGHVLQVKAQVNAARIVLHEAKANTAAYTALRDKGDAAFNAMTLVSLQLVEDEKRKTYRQLLKVRDSLMGVK